ncbi:MAG: hypothetical protein ACOX0R_01305 [Candidatus Dojkabacteria bacterium]
MLDILKGNKPLFIKELHTVHKMISTRKTFTGRHVNYISEWLKLLKSISWKIFHIRNIDQIEWRRVIDEIDKDMIKTDKNKKGYLRIMKENRRDVLERDINALEGRINSNYN